jgi:ketosteroid isomerase-like protein
MSQENVEIVKRGIDAYNRRDFDAYIALTTSDFELFPAMDRTVEARSYWGHEGIETYLADIGEAWAELRLLPEEWRDLGGRVLMPGRAQGRGRGSSVPVDAHVGFLVDFRDGKMSRVLAFLDHGEALRAAGLSE